MKIHLLFIPIIILSIIIEFGPDKRFRRESIKPDSLSSITISFVGDLMCHSPQIDYAEVGKDSFDFKPVFREIKRFLTKSDLTIGNLETVIAGKEKKYSGYPFFNTPHQFLEALKDAGFDILITSNNHSLDRGTKGIERTIEKIKEYGMIPLGTSISQNDRDSTRVIVTNGIKLGLLSYTYGLSGNLLPKDKNFMVNIIDTNTIKNDIGRLIKKCYDLIIVYYHFGDEYSRTPSRYQKEIVSKTIEYGAGIIIASHAHVVQPFENFQTKSKKFKKGVVAYSLGNFLSNQRWRYSDAGVILNLEISKNINRDSLWLSSIEIIPTWVYKGEMEKRNEFIIIPADTSLINHFNYITKSDRVKLIQSYGDTSEMFKVILDNSSQHFIEKSN